MKYLLPFIIIFWNSLNAFAYTSNDSILQVLYKTMDEKNVYAQEKENEINEIKKLLKTPNISNDQLYDINFQLHNEYKTYISDSAIYYACQNLTIAAKLENRNKVNESHLVLAGLYSVAGLYLDAVAQMKFVNKNSLPDYLLLSYYDTYAQIYNAYSHINELYAKDYYLKSTLYRDSLLLVLDKNSNHYRIVYAEKLYDNNKLQEAKILLADMLANSKTEDHERAVLAYALSNVYKKENNVELQERYLVISAICDIKNAIKENASLQALSSILYSQDDIPNAYRCIKLSMEDAMFCNAKLRTIEVSRIFPIIDTAYQESIDKQNDTLKTSLIVVIVLLLFLLAAIIYVYKQMKRIAGIRKELYNTNVKLNDLNNDLVKANENMHSVNNRLSEVNSELSEANQIKETYIGHFLDLCSTYILKLEKYKNTLNKKAAEKKLDELYKMLKSNELIDSELKELYENFDNIFLHLYPNFVDDFNMLLLEDERFTLKTNGLNTELRIFALIRLGITDSSRIANFLHYSANTIYNYRTRIRNKAAVPREDFEYLVRKIGIISK